MKKENMKYTHTYAKRNRIRRKERLHTAEDEGIECVQIPSYRL